MKLGSKCLSNAAATKIGKYGIGTKIIILPTKLINKMPKYPKLSKNVKSSSRLAIKYVTRCFTLYLVVVKLCSGL
jgi:hypothetical protein